jgi:hypothetical protein
VGDAAISSQPEKNPGYRLSAKIIELDNDFAGAAARG